MLPGEVDALAITDWCCRVGIIVVSHLIVKNNLAGLVVPDLKAELVDAPTLGCLAVDDRQQVFVTGFVIELAVTLELRAHSGK